MRITVLTYIILLLSVTAQADFTGTVTKVYDGDTATVVVDTTTYKVRLYGIDAPEKAQAYGVESTRALSQMILGKTVTVEEHGKDQYQRIIGVIWLEKVDINKEMLAKGHASCYKQYNRIPEYAVVEAAARSKKIGIWATDNPQAPWEYRKAMKNVRK